MTIPTVAVTVKLANLTGVADVVGKTVTATLDKADRYGGFLVPSSVSGVVDASGDVVLQCFPNNPTTGLGTTGSVYTFACKALSFRETAQVPNSACNLHDIADLATAVSDSALDLHIADTAGAHAASAISVAAIAGISGTTGQTVLAELAANKEATANKDASGGYAGLTLFKLNLRNALGTITSFFTTAATVARTWTLPDKDGTVAMTSDVTALTPAPSTEAVSRDLTAADQGKVLNCTATITLTIQTGLPAGFGCAIVQSGAGQVTIAAGVGVTLNNVDSQTKTSGQNAAVGIINTASEVYNLTGATGA